jgi:hypothetical protein
MKEKRIDYRDIVEFRDGLATEFSLRQILRSNGFDLSKPIVRYDDYGKSQIVFQQEDEEERE